MNIELVNTLPWQLKVTWPDYGVSINSAVIDRLRVVPGAEPGRGRLYWCPLLQLARLIELFPKASYDYAALQAADHAARTFYESAIGMGIALIIDASGAVCAVGENVSPLVERIVSERSHALKPFVVEAVAVPKLRSVGHSAPHGPLTKEDAGWKRVMDGAKNAVAKAEEQAEKFKFQKRRRKAKKEKVA